MTKELTLEQIAANQKTLDLAGMDHGDPTNMDEVDEAYDKLTHHWSPEDENPFPPDEVGVPVSAETKMISQVTLPDRGISATPVSEPPFIDDDPPREYQPWHENAPEDHNPWRGEE